MSSKVSFLRRENLTRGWLLFPSTAQLLPGLQRTEAKGRFQVSGQQYGWLSWTTPCNGSPPFICTEKLHVRGLPLPEYRRPERQLLCLSQKCLPQTHMCEDQVTTLVVLFWQVGKPLSHGTCLMGVGHSGPCLLCFFYCHFPSLWLAQPLQPSFSSMRYRNELKKKVFFLPLQLFLLGIFVTLRRNTN